MPPIDVFGAVLVGYVVGSIPFAVLVTRAMGGDVRGGSGNPGATNVLRTSGVAAGALVAALDIAKGAASVLLAQRMGASETVAAAGGAAAVIGHVFPIWLRFRGGKGVATGFGAFLVLAPAAALVALSVFAVVVWITRHVSLGSIVAAAALPPLVYTRQGPGSILLASFLVGALVIVRHRSNMERLLAGAEPRL